MRQHCRDNMTMVSGLKVVGFGLFTIFVVELHLDSETLIFFEFFLVPEALLRCPVVVDAKLNNCRVPSSD